MGQKGQQRRRDRIAALCMSSVSSWRTLMSSWSHEKPTLVEWLPGSRAGSVRSTSGSAAASSSLICAKACALVVAGDDGEIDGAPSGRRVQRVVANALQLSASQRIHRHEFAADGGTNGGSRTRGQRRGRKTCVCCRARERVGARLCDCERVESVRGGLGSLSGTCAVLRCVGIAYDAMAHVGEGGRTGTSYSNGVSMCAVFRSAVSAVSPTEDMRRPVPRVLPGVISAVTESARRTPVPTCRTAESRCRCGRRVSPVPVQRASRVPV